MANINGTEHPMINDEAYAHAVQAENRKIERKMIASQILASLHGDGRMGSDEDLPALAQYSVKAADALLAELDK